MAGSPTSDCRDSLVRDAGLTMRRFVTTNLFLRCPFCVRAKVTRGLFALKTRCKACGTRFERLAGNFLVSMSLNYFVTVVLLVVLGFFLVRAYGFFDGLAWLLVGVAAVTVVLLYRPMQVLTLWLLWVFGLVYPD